MTFMDWLIGRDTSLGVIELRQFDPHQRREFEEAERQMSLEAHETDIETAKVQAAHARVIADREARADAINRRWAIQDAGSKVTPHRRRA